jgi:hypothetical protein
VAPTIVAAPVDHAPAATPAAAQGHAAPHLRAVHHDKVLAFGQGLLYAEFVRRSARYGPLLRTRLAEARLGPAIQMAAAGFPETLNIVVVLSEEDPDTLCVLPLVQRLAAAGPRLHLRIFCDDDNLSPLAVLAPELDVATLLDEWDLPQFLCFDEDWYLQAQWGPRPQAAEPKVEAWLAAHPHYAALAEDETAAGHERYLALLDELVYEMRLWYNSGLATHALDEWLDLLRVLQGGDEPPADAPTDAPADATSDTPADAPSGATDPKGDRSSDRRGDRPNDRGSSRRRDDRDRDRNRNRDANRDRRSDRSNPPAGARTGEGST